MNKLDDDLLAGRSQRIRRHSQRSPRCCESLAWLLAIACVWLGYHYWTIDVQSLFNDEIDELRFTRLPIWEAVNQADSMPPMFTLLLRGWLAVWNSDAAGRWFPVLVGLLTLCCWFTYTRQVFGIRTAVVSTAIIATSPLFLYYSQLIRGYCLLLLFCTLALATWHRVLRTGSGTAWTVYAFVTVLGMYTHYYFFILPFFFAAVFLVTEVGGLRRSQDSSQRVVFAGRSFARSHHWRGWLATHAVIFCCCLPLLFFVWTDYRFQHDLRAARPLTLQAAAYTNLSLHSGYALGASQRELHGPLSPSLIWESSAWLSLVAVLQATMLVGSWRFWRTNQLSPYLLTLLLGPLPLLAAIGSIAGLTYNVRFVCWLILPLGLLLSGWADPRSSTRPILTRISVVAFALLLGVHGYANYHRVYNPRYQFEDFRGAARVIESLDPSGRATVFVLADYCLSPASYYLPTQTTIVMLPDPDRINQTIDDDAEADAVLARIKAAGPAFLLYSRAFHGDPHALLLERLRPIAQELPGAAGVRIFRFNNVRG